MEREFRIVSDKPEYLYIHGEKKSLRISLTDEGLTAFAEAWKEILEIPEARDILEKYKIQIEEVK